MVMSKIVTIHERATGSALSSPRKEQGNSPVVPNVKVLGIDSKNGRKYPLEVMEKSLQKYEGAIVNIDHPAGSEPRKYEDRFGRLTNARLESDGIYADLTYNPKHPLAEGFEWWVQNDPKAIGLSHNAQAKTKMSEEGVEEIEEIVQVDSVDLVAEPATTAGLLEAVMVKNPVKESRWDSSLGRVYLGSGGFGGKDIVISEKVFPSEKEALNWVSGEFRKAVQKRKQIAIKNEKNKSPSAQDEMWIDGKVTGVVLDYDTKAKATGPLSEKMTESLKNAKESDQKALLAQFGKAVKDLKAAYQTGSNLLRQVTAGDWRPIMRRWDSIDIGKASDCYADFQDLVNSSKESVAPEVKEQPQKFVGKILVSTEQYPAVGGWLRLASKVEQGKDLKAAVASLKVWMGAALPKAQKDVGTNPAFSSQNFPEKLVFKFTITDEQAGKVVFEKQFPPVSYKKRESVAIKRKLVAEAIKKVLSQKGAK